MEEEKGNGKGNKLKKESEWSEKKITNVRIENGSEEKVKKKVGDQKEAKKLHRKENRRKVKSRGTK